MSETKFTPGPWSAGGTQAGSAVFAGQECVASLSFTMPPVEQRAANAHLIAAAPDLLKALGPLVFSDPESPPPGVMVEDWRGAVEAARTAHSKALGGQP